jgi:fructose-1,6-bisphosphatase/inositol monophosphatase family enzyme
MNTNNRLQNIWIWALKEAYKVHESLWINWEKSVSKNQHGETALRVDIECEKAIIDFFIKNNISIKFISEEHGITIIWDKPKYTAILDWLDWTGVYKKSRWVWRYGTMLWIFSGLNPTYKDYIFSGIIEHVSNKIFYALKNSGSYITNDSENYQIYCNSKTKIDKEWIIYIDEYWDLNIKTFSDKLVGYNKSCLGSSCIYYIDVASGNADFALECTRKWNLEIAVAYGLIKESGWVMVTLDWESLDEKKYLDFWQKTSIPIITASNISLARDLIKIL